MEKFNLIPIENEGKRVLTTAQLAESYETTEKRITENFNRNSDRYTEGKHFYCLTGDELKKFLHSANCGLQNTSKIRTLYLWTEKGALLHAKSLNTDKAWEVYDFLVENYFQKKEPDYSALSPQLQFLIQMEQRQNQLEQKQKELEAKLEFNKTEVIKAAFEYGRIGILQREEIQKAVKKRAIEICQYAETYDKVGKSVISSIYKALQKHFEISSYLDLAYNQYTDAMIFVQYFEPDPKLYRKVMDERPKLDMTLMDVLFGEMKDD
ncbi:MAG: ORF6N domain-containing protein [Oscillospiraceae bacterium]|nr:ORF6N domain-containing protein [Oscillospiraceae bacterium]